MIGTTWQPSIMQIVWGLGEMVCGVTTASQSNGSGNESEKVGVILFEKMPCNIVHCLVHASGLGALGVHWGYIVKLVYMMFQIQSSSRFMNTCSGSIHIAHFQNVTARLHI